MKRDCTPRIDLSVVFAAVALLIGNPIWVKADEYYYPTNWVNDPWSYNQYWELLYADTPHPVYTNIGPNYTANLFGHSPIGATVTLQNIGDTIMLLGQVTLIGQANNGNVQWRIGLFYKGTNPTDTGWAGYMIGQVNYNGPGGIYFRNIPNSGIYGSGAGCTMGTTTEYLFSPTWGQGTYDIMLSITRTGPNETLMRWKLVGQSPNTYVYAGRATNSNASATGGFSFDHVGFLSGGGVWGGPNGVIAFSNLVVVVGRYTDGSWTNDADGIWSDAGNWAYGAVANGAGFVGAFDRVNLTADRIVTLDTSRSLGRLVFGGPMGNPHNWVISGAGGAVLMLDRDGLGTPIITVNQNSATINVRLISSNGLTKTGPGTLVLRGNNTIVGALNLYGGAVNFLSLANLPLGWDGIQTINFSGGALQWAPGNTIDISALGIEINFNGNAGFDTGPNNVTLANSFGNWGSGSLIKLGSGKLTLNGIISYNGSTIISNGTLALGQFGSISSSTNFVVYPGAVFDVAALGGFIIGYNQVFSCGGTVVGKLTHSSGGILHPGFAGVPGTLTINGDLSLAGGKLVYDLSDTTVEGRDVNDLIVVNGNLDLSSPTELQLNLVAGAPGIGIYTLVQYNTLSGDIANLMVPPGYILTNDTVQRKIGLIVEHIPVELVWRGDGMANVWDTGVTANWIHSGTNRVFRMGDSVVFDDTGFNTPPIYINGTVYPALVTVNSTKDYTFTGGGIGSGRLVKLGAGRLVLENDNTYLGSTTIGGGVLQVGNGGTTGTLGVGPTTNNAALVFNRADDYTYTNSIFGSGSITNSGVSGTLTLSGPIAGNVVAMVGAGDMVLTGSNSYTGLTIVSSGTLHVRNGAALGSASVGTVATNGGRVYIDANVDITGESFVLGGEALRKGGAGPTTLGGSITLVSDTTIHVDGNSTLNLTNPAGINGVGFNLTLSADGGGQGNVLGPINLGIGSLTKVGGGTWTLGPTNNYTGKTVIAGGVLAVPAATALGPVSTFTPDYVLLSGGALGVTTNVTFSDGLRGITASGTAGGFDVPAGLTLLIANEISGDGVITKSGGGALVLAGSNSFSGTLYVDTGANAVSDGVVVIAHPHAIANVASPIAIRNTLGGSSTLQLDGTRGNITITQDITMNGRSPALPTIQNRTGTNTLAGDIIIGGTGIKYIFQSDAGLLRITGSITNQATGAQTITFQGDGDILITGRIQDGAFATGLEKNGNGVLTLAGENTYSGETVINGGWVVVTGTIGSGGVRVLDGALSGSGTINGNVRVYANGVLAPGTSVGQLTITGTLTNEGLILIEVNKSDSTIAADSIAGLQHVTYGGTLQLVLSGDPLRAGDAIRIFGASTYSGTFNRIVPEAPGDGLAWDASTLNSDGTLRVVSVGVSQPRFASVSVSDGKIVLGVAGGIAGRKCFLLGSTNLMLPLSQWTRVHTNVFAQDGTLWFTNAVVPDMPQRFFTIQVE